MPVIEIKDLQDRRLEPYFSLTEKGLKRSDILMAESPKVIERALGAGLQPLSLLCERKHLEGDAAGIIERNPDIPVFTGDRETLADITGYELTRGVLCAMRRPEIMPAEELLSGSRRICVIYDICDSTNVGVIFRSAAALGYDGILLSAGSCDPLNRRTIRVSMGTVFQIKWAISGDVMQDLKRNSFVSVSTALNKDSISLEKFVNDPETRYGIIFGSEGYGLPDDLIGECDFTVTIPMHAGVDSLNVGAAAAIALWHFRLPDIPGKAF